MTIGQLIDTAVGPIALGMSPTPHRDAEELYALAAGIAITEIDRDAEPDDKTAEEFQRLTDSRISGVPMAYLTGVAPFAGLELRVGAGVFVPRRDFSDPVEPALEHVRATTAPLIVDLCAGAGAVALAVAHRRPDAEVHAVEIDEQAYGFAELNAADRVAAGDTAIHLHRGDVTAPDVLAELNGRVDVVVTNPPFVPEHAQLPPEFAVHQPRIAIYAGPDGLDVIRGAVDTAARLLRPGGALVLEHGHLHGETMPALFAADTRFTGVTLHPDRFGYPLYLLALRAG
ncbi:N5-glutamine methyltransferase family protein [Amorphoplanes digitatis]|uniref:peptide chain release factor N(5)-glutamine methyltransferase n=1 Tax=Actinoplanes digitatis TaxID=1868 RepID=A0A7W7HV94_9ACTN|nr:HemK/PrmC family methyltransferase [Actinoplanes digitatis]MBB4761447.1 release factor glutamine methyltransferase [Actinoplanes digitatis]GID97707.1 release factor glutamine methyltransferase [Actinoplanes digitatis]